MPEPINTHDPTALTEYFNREVKRPGWRPWLRGLDDLDLGIAAGPVHVGKLMVMFRSVTTDSRLRYAAYRWLSPRRPTPIAADIAAIQSVAGLDHLDRKTFSAKLTETLEELQRDHPRLALWILRRLALLDEPPEEEVFQELKDNAWRIGYSLATALLVARQEPPEANRLAKDACVSALTAAAEAVRRVLGKGGCSLSANLMVPAALGANPVPCLEPTNIVTSNAGKAEALWRELPSYKKEKSLVIMAETPGVNQVGFWVPLALGDEKACLPGAPAAFIFQRAAAVFANDLPSLVGFPGTLRETWNHYMHQDFEDQMFVSLPFVMRKTATGNQQTIAVLNVNANPPSDDGWRRGYHDEWLVQATERAAPFMGLALLALSVQLETSPTSQRTGIEPGSEVWNLPAKGE
jgi:hypothetical protein